jgi:UTP--glucose-1-phosphate uridylyltransferase
MIDKAVIPVAGLGTRMGALARFVPKAMLPLIDARGRLRPTVHWICLEAAEAGVKAAAVVVAPRHLEMIGQYFDCLGREEREELPEKISFIAAEPLGFGYAVLQCEAFIGKDAFMLFLGDHVHRDVAGAASCAAQVALAWERRGGVAMVGMQAVGAEELPMVGVAAGEELGGGIYRCRHFVEKPDLPTARRLLRTPGLGADRFLAHCGIYIFSPEIIGILKELEAARADGQEVQLAQAQSMLLDRRPDDYYLIEIHGRAYDTGSPAGYLAAQDAWRKT